MFWFFVLTNFLFHFFYLSVPGIILCIVGIWVKSCLWIGLAILGLDVILSIMCERKPNQAEKISFRTERLKPFLPKNITPKETEDYVLKALEHYHRYRERMKERDR